MLRKSYPLTSNFSKSYEKTAIIKNLSVGSLSRLMPPHTNPHQKVGLTITSDLSLKYLLNLSICITVILFNSSHP